MAAWVAGKKGILSASVQSSILMVFGRRLLLQAVAAAVEEEYGEEAIHQDRPGGVACLGEVGQAIDAEQDHGRQNHQQPSNVPRLHESSFPARAPPAFIALML